MWTCNKPLQDEQVLGQGLKDLALGILEGNLTRTHGSGDSVGCLRKTSRHSGQDVLRAHPWCKRHRKNRHAHRDACQQAPL